MFKKKVVNKTFVDTVDHVKERMDKQSAKLNDLEDRLTRQGNELSTILDREYPCKFRYSIEQKTGRFGETNTTHYCCTIREHVARGCGYLYIFRDCRDCKERMS